MEDRKAKVVAKTLSLSRDWPRELECEAREPGADSLAGGRLFYASCAARSSETTATIPLPRPEVSHLPITPSTLARRSLSSAALPATC